MSRGPWDIPWICDVHSGALNTGHEGHMVLMVCHEVYEGSTPCSRPLQRDDTSSGYLFTIGVQVQSHELSYYPIDRSSD